MESIAAPGHYVVEQVRPFHEDTELTDAHMSLRVEFDGPIAHLRFSRPESMNAINIPLAEAFLAGCREVAAAPGIRVVVLSGKGNAFMAGGDLGCFSQDLGRAQDVADAIIDPLHKALAILARLSQPVIASVQGAVAGAGVSLMLACDLAIAADNARFNLAYARIGASLDGSGSWSLPRVVGLRRAMELALLSETIDASTALALGMVNRVVSAAALADETAALARRLADGPTQALGRIKALLRESHLRDMEAQMAAEHAAFRACAGEPDFAEGVAAFLEKRAPRFAGGR